MREQEAGKTKKNYGLRFHLSRMSKQIGRQLCLAMTREEDARLWRKYKDVLNRQRMLEKSEGAKDAPVKCAHSLRPEFNEEYVELTRQLREAYGRRKAADSKEQRQLIGEEIRALKQKRYTVTTYYDRETGEVVSPGRPPAGCSV